MKPFYLFNYINNMLTDNNSATKYRTNTQYYDSI